MSKHHQIIVVNRLFQDKLVEAAKTSDDVNITGMFGILVLAGLGWYWIQEKENFVIVR